jgi:mannosidase alpha-like ER degradation enhancer 2
VEVQKNLGRFTPWEPGNKESEGVDFFANRYANQLQAKFPTATLELYLNGDVCGNFKPQTDVDLSVFRRTTAVVIHDDDSRHCSESEVTQQDLTHPIIESVEEPKVCSYIFHVCPPSPPEPEEDDNLEQLDSKKNAAPITESDADELNQTMNQIHNVMHAYLHETSADAHQKANPDRTTSLHVGLPPLPKSRIQANVDLIQEMFTHAYDSYMYHAYPASEIKPITCKPAVFSLVKIPALTLIDALDTLVILGNYTEFARSVERLRHLDKLMREESGILVNGGLFALNQNVSVFETNIRVLGGLLSAHQLAEAFLPSKVYETDVWDEDKTVLIGREPEVICKSEEDTSTAKTAQRECTAAVSLLDECTATKAEEAAACQNQTAQFWKYDGFLLELAQDIGNRLLPAFDTRTGIPYGTVNLLSGIPKGETTIASLAGGGTLSLEMELLSRLTGYPEYGRAAKLAARALWMRRSQYNLLGKHICTNRGDWTESLSGIGSNSDSYYEYLIKHYILFPEDQDFWIQMVSAYSGVHNESRLGEWYGDVDLNRGLSTGGGAKRVFESLMAFYPGMQVLLGELTPAARSLNSFFLVREYLGFLPERFNFGFWKVDSNGGKHYLRPELLESAYFLHRATKGFQQQFRNNSNYSLDSSGWQWASDFALHTLEKSTRVECGYASLMDLSPTTTGAAGLGRESLNRNANLMDEMPSFFLSETLKYLYLTFDEDNPLHTDQDRDWVFTTEAHPIHHANPPRHANKMLKLKEQRMELMGRLRSRIQGRKATHQAESYGLIDEKWADLSKMRPYVLQLDPIARKMDEEYGKRMCAGAEHGPEFLKTSSMVEPILSPEQILYANNDLFNETQNGMNAAHLTFRKMGSSGYLSQSCPNFYMTDFLWVRALNGGATDYADAYMSSAQDTAVAGESRFYMLGAVDALALLGSGVHVSQLYDESNSCSVEERDKETATSSATSPNSSEQKGKDRFDMGEGLGNFDVSAFPGGSGFYIRHVETGETLVTTVIDDDTGKDESYVMVYSSNTATETEDIQNNDRSETKVESQPLTPLNRNAKNSDSAVPTGRSVIMADLKGNAFVCQIEVLESFFKEQDGDGGSASSLDPLAKEDEDAEEEVEDAEKVLASYPCAPALFGPTHMSILAVTGGVVVEASIRTPEADEEYGCDHLMNDNGNNDYMPMVVQNEEGHSPNSIPHSSEEQPAESDDDLIKENTDDTCLNRVVQLLHRGVCTFQEKALSQKKVFNAEAVIVINSEPDELFVMSGGGTDDPDYLDNNNFPATVLVTGSDGKAILDITGSFQPNEESELRLRVSLLKDKSRIVESGKMLAVKGNDYWPAVRVNSDALQVFASGGWGVHAVQKNEKSKAEALEWQLYVMRHELQPESP